MSFPARKTIFCIASFLLPYGQAYRKRFRPMIYHPELLVRKFSNLKPFFGFVDMSVLVLKD
jgi:hypothetical protein